MHTLILGLDGLDYNLLHLALPNMPFFQQLMKESAWGMMRPDIALSPQSWSTIFTGLSERRHKVTSFHTPLSRVKVPTLWSILNEYDRTVGVFNVPMTFPASIIKGYMVSGPPCPYPASEPEDILQREPPQMQGSGHAWKRHRWAVREGLWLTLEHNPWCSIIGTTLVDEFGHGWNTAWSKGKPWMVEKAYPKLDTDIGQLVQELQPEVLAVFSDHGWGCQVDSSTLYNKWHDGLVDNETKRAVTIENWAWHTKEGVGFFRGPHVKPNELEPFTNRDFLPTMLDIWNLRPPHEFEGQSVVKFQYTDNEEAAIKERLTALGYLA